MQAPSRARRAGRSLPGATLTAVAAASSGREESRAAWRGRGRGREPPHRGDGERVRADSAPGAAPGGKVSPSVVQGTGHHASGSGALGATRLPPGVRMQRVHNLPPLPPSFLSLPSPSSPPLSFRIPAPCSRVAAPHRGRPHARQRPPSPPPPPPTPLSPPLLPPSHSPTRAVSRRIRDGRLRVETCCERVGESENRSSSDACRAV